jgi:hypothetical protein
MINKNTPLILRQWATTREVNEGGSNNGSGNLSGQTQLLLRWQRQEQPVQGDTIHVLVLTVVDEGSWWRRQWRWAAVGGGRQC